MFDLTNLWFIGTTRSHPLVDGYVEVSSVEDFIQRFGVRNSLYYSIRNYFFEAPYRFLITNGVDEVYTPYQWHLREEARSCGESFWHSTVLTKKVC